MIIVAILSREDYLESLNTLVGEDNTDEALQIIEDFTDTFDNLGTQNDNNDNENWKQKYEELDATWRQKYRDRFMNSQTTEEDVIEEQEDNVETDGELKEYDELFEEREG